uniref:Lipocalin/cytosolic fatty-acid binding domain-containing protein n=1 Tax=Mus spicilegus TaxID=10103 RepID=A0A8C6GX00_MUSSI
MKYKVINVNKRLLLILQKQSKVKWNQKLEIGTEYRVQNPSRSKSLTNQLTLFYRRDEECSEISMVADKTEKAGEYSVTYDGFNTFTIPKTDYDNFIMAHLINEKDGETFQLMGLYGREPDLSSDIKERFAQLCEKHGILRENIIDLSNSFLNAGE